MRLKKVMATGLVAALALSTMVGCSSKKDSSDQKKIGVVQLVEHDALDASYKGLRMVLRKLDIKTETRSRLNIRTHRMNSQIVRQLPNNLSQISAILY